MTEQQHILVVDDDADILTAAKLLLKRSFAGVTTTSDPNEIPELIRASKFAAVLLDMNFSPGKSDGQAGFHWLKEIKKIAPEIVVVMITAHGGIDIAVEAMKYGATDFITKPWENQKVVTSLHTALKLNADRIQANNVEANIEVSNQQENQTGILGQSKAMTEVFSMISRSAPTEANVLITGENGTGKELVAREIHRQSTRTAQTFLTVDLGSISESLFESELFGHKKGAFTGADHDRTGRLVAADKGTLFLDEVGNLPLHLQAKLLTVLEQRQVTPLGSNQSIAIDVRVLAATNMSRSDLSNEKKFRQDLLFRLNTVEIPLPALRERSEDITTIAAHYIELYCGKYNKPLKNLSQEATEATLQYNWPGNVRALRHTIERAVILAEGPLLELEDLQLPAQSDAQAPEAGVNHDLNLERNEKRTIEAALKKNRFNISKASKELGLTRAALYRRMEKHGL